MKKFLVLLKNTYLGWDKNDPWAKSAVIAYYALFSLPSLLMITMYIAGLFVGKEAVQGKITDNIGSMIGADSATAIEVMIANAALETSSTFTIIIGVGTLIFGATGVFFQLQKALNEIWSVRAKSSSFIVTLRKRALSFGLIVVIGFLLLISLVVSSAIDALVGYLASHYSEISSIALVIANFLLSGVFITALFVMVFTILPDIKVRWRTSIIGAVLTSLLFMAGKYLIGFYITRADPTSVYGAAGSIVLILLWVYYTCLILFFGAEFTVQWAFFKDVKIMPNNGAVMSYQKEIEELRDFKKQVEQNNRDAIRQE